MSIMIIAIGVVGFLVIVFVCILFDAVKEDPNKKEKPTLMQEIADTIPRTHFTGKGLEKKKEEKKEDNDRG